MGIVKQLALAAATCVAILVLAVVSDAALEIYFLRRDAQTARASRQRVRRNERLLGELAVAQRADAVAALSGHNIGAGEKSDGVLLLKCHF